MNAKLKAMAGGLACSVLGGVSGCQIPSLRHAEPGAIVPAGYLAAAPLSDDTNSLGALVGGAAVVRPPAPPAPPAAASADTSAALPIEEFYSDPILIDVLHQALVNNRELKILEQEVQIARNEVWRLRGTYWPFIGVGGGAGIDRPSAFTRGGAIDSSLQIIPGQAIPSPIANYGYGLDVKWQLDIWRQLRNARDAAQHRYISMLERKNFFVTRLIAETAEKYYELIALDNRVENLNRIIRFQQDSLYVAEARKEAGRDNELPVQRFLAEVRKNQAEKQVIAQDIIQAENRINTLLNRYPQPVRRSSADFYNLEIHALGTGVPSQLLQNRPDIRAAERELAASGLDVKVARAAFFPTLSLSAGVGYEAFNPRYLFNPEALAANLVGNLSAPLLNKKAIQADYLNANARQLEAMYEYQRTVVNAFTEVINRVSMVENYRRSVETRKQQVEALEQSVAVATRLYNAARVEYTEVLFTQRDLRDAQLVLIDAKRQQLSAVVFAYQALGGGDVLPDVSEPPPQHVFWKRILGLHRSFPKAKAESGPRADQ